MTEATSETDLVLDVTSEETSAVAPPRPVERTRAAEARRLAKRRARPKSSW